MTITGAGDGIMGAAQLGAGRERSFGLNIKLPFEQSANEIIATRLHSMKAMVIASAPRAGIKSRAMMVKATNNEANSPKPEIRFGMSPERQSSKKNPALAMDDRTRLKWKLV